MYIDLYWKCLPKGRSFRLWATDEKNPTWMSFILSPQMTSMCNMWRLPADPETSQHFGGLAKHQPQPTAPYLQSVLLSALLCPEPELGQLHNDPTGSHSAAPLQLHEWKWNWFKKAYVSSQAGIEGIIVQIVVIPRPSPTLILLIALLCFSASQLFVFLLLGKCSLTAIPLV